MIKLIYIILIIIVVINGSICKKTINWVNPIVSGEIPINRMNEGYGYTLGNIFYIQLDGYRYKLDVDGIVTEEVSNHNFIARGSVGLTHDNTTCSLLRGLTNSPDTGITYLRIGISRTKGVWTVLNALETLTDMETHMFQYNEGVTINVQVELRKDPPAAPRDDYTMMNFFPQQNDDMILVVNNDTTKWRWYAHMQNGVGGWEQKYAEIEFDGGQQSKNQVSLRMYANPEVKKSYFEVYSTRSGRTFKEEFDTIYPRRISTQTLRGMHHGETRSYPEDFHSHIWEPEVIYHTPTCNIISTNNAIHKYTLWNDPSTQTESDMKTGYGCGTCGDAVIISKSGHTITRIANGRFLQYGGTVGTSALGTLYGIYQDVGNSYRYIYETLASHDRVKNHIAIFWNRGLYVYGGENEASVITDRLNRYDILENSWTSITSNNYGVTNLKRSKHTAQLSDGKFLL